MKIDAGNTEDARPIRDVVLGKKKTNIFVKPAEYDNLPTLFTDTIFREE